MGNFSRVYGYSCMCTIYGKTFEGENFCGCAQNTIHWKTFAVHQAHAIMYCTRQVIQGESFRDRLKNHENRESFPPRKFCPIRYIAMVYIATGHSCVLVCTQYAAIVNLATHSYSYSYTTSYWHGMQIYTYCCYWYY